MFNWPFENRFNFTFSCSSFLARLCVYTFVCTLCMFPCVVSTRWHHVHFDRIVYIFLELTFKAIKRGYLIKTCLTISLQHTLNVVISYLLNVLNSLGFTLLQLEHASQFVCDHILMVESLILIWTYQNSLCVFDFVSLPVTRITKRWCTIRFFRSVHSPCQSFQIVELINSHLEFSKLPNL